MYKQSRYRKWHKKALVVATVLLATLVTLLYFAIYHKTKTQVDTPTQTVKMSTLHPTYDSVEAMIGAEDASLAAEAVVIDEGKVRSTRDVADENVPPDVHTDYRVRLAKVIKGDVDSREVVITLMGGRGR